MKSFESLVERGILYASHAGWESKISNMKTDHCILAINGSEFKVSSQPWPEYSCDEKEKGKADFYLRKPWDIAIESLIRNLDRSLIIGHATIISPVGEYHSLKKSGTINSVLIESAYKSEFENWTYSFASSSHSTLWLIDVTIAFKDINSAQNSLDTICKNIFFVELESWVTIADTSRLIEFFRDTGYTDAYNPFVTILSKKLIQMERSVTVNLWLSINEGLTSIDLAKKISRIKSPDITEQECIERLYMNNKIDTRGCIEKYIEPKSKIRRRKVGIVGLGIIGKRVADAIIGISELELHGISVNHITPGIIPYLDKGVKIYESCNLNKELKPDHIKFEGSIFELIQACDVIIDCTSKGNGEKLNKLYKNSQARIIFQGGESSTLADLNYCSGIGFNEAITASSVRVLSCNCTGIIRIAQIIEQIEKIEKLRVVLIRSSSDPDKINKGQPNNILLSPGESHHSYDIKDIWPDLNITTIASYAPINCGHIITLLIKVCENVNPNELYSALRSAPRVNLVEGECSLKDIRSIYYNNSRSDCHDVVVWQDAIIIKDDEIIISAGIHMESITIPEILDVLFAMTGLTDNHFESIRRTNEVLYPYTRR